MLASVEAFLLYFIYAEFDYFNAKFFLDLIISGNLEINNCATALGSSLFL